jgi:hypothetical protein
VEYHQIQRADSTRKLKLRKKAGRGELQNARRTVLARERLPNRRASETFNFEVEGLRYCATVSRFVDGRIGEIFLSNHKVGSQSDASATDAAVAASLALQHGCTLEVLRGALLRDMGGRAATPLGVALDLVAEPQGSKANAGAARRARRETSPFYLGAHKRGRGKARQS